MSGPHWLRAVATIKASGFQQPHAAATQCSDQCQTTRPPADAAGLLLVTCIEEGAVACQQVQLELAEARSPWRGVQGDCRRYGAARQLDGQNGPLLSLLHDIQVQPAHCTGSIIRFQCEPLPVATCIISRSWHDPVAAQGLR